MKFADGMEREWEKGWGNNKDPYGNGVYTYAKRWAELMEKDIEELGIKRAMELFYKRSHDADIEGITGYMYGCAVNILYRVWEHGETLRKWHNKKYDYDGDGVVNPAVLTITKEVEE